MHLASADVLISSQSYGRIKRVSSAIYRLRITSQLKLHGKYLIYT